MVTGYEIKVSRPDFLRDEKYPAYLKYCNCFYFVCPPHLIEPAELSENIGLLWTSSTGSRLYTKKKAPYRQIEIPAELYKYILISRAFISDTDITLTRKREYWESWLKEKKLNHEFGCHVAMKIREEIDKRILSDERESENLKDQMLAYDNLVLFLESIGVDPTRKWHSKTLALQKV